MDTVSEDNFAKHCAYCGEVFESDDEDDKYCSAMCEMKAERDEEAEALEDTEIAVTLD